MRQGLQRPKTGACRCPARSPPLCGRVFGEEGSSCCERVPEASHCVPQCVRRTQALGFFSFHPRLFFLCPTVRMCWPQNFDYGCRFSAECFLGTRSVYGGSAAESSHHVCAWSIMDACPPLLWVLTEPVFALDIQALSAFHFLYNLAVLPRDKHFCYLLYDIV